MKDPCFGRPVHAWTNNYVNGVWIPKEKEFYGTFLAWGVDCMDEAGSYSVAIIELEKSGLVKMFTPGCMRFTDAPDLDGED